MTTLMDSLSQTVTPQVLGSIGKKIGVDEATAQKGMDAAVPAVLGSLGKTAAGSPSGIDDIMKQMGDLSAGSPNGDILGSVLSSVTGGGQMPTTGSADPLGGLLGPGVDAISGTLSRSLGFDVKPLLTMAVPIVMGLISKTMTAQNLDKQGVARMIEDESSAYFAKGGETATLVQNALTAGDDAAALREKFKDGWADVVMAPLAAAKLVMTSDKSGPLGAMKELGAAGEVLAAAAKQSEPVSVINMAFASDPSMDVLEKVQAIKNDDVLLGMIKTAVGAVGVNSPTEANAYRQLITSVAIKVAEASKEGSFLGIGGTLVSDKEKAALAAIQSAVA